MGDILNINTYSIAWVTVLLVEAGCALGMLDNRQEMKSAPRAVGLEASASQMPKQWSKSDDM
jgi:hypothetical protein